MMETHAAKGNLQTAPRQKSGLFSCCFRRSRLPVDQTVPSSSTNPSRVDRVSFSPLKQDITTQLKARLETTNMDGLVDTILAQKDSQPAIEWVATQFAILANNSVGDREGLVVLYKVYQLAAELHPTTKAKNTPIEDKTEMDIFLSHFFRKLSKDKFGGNEDVLGITKKDGRYLLEDITRILKDVVVGELDVVGDAAC